MTQGDEGWTACYRHGNGATNRLGSVDMLDRATTHLNAVVQAGQLAAGALNVRRRAPLHHQSVAFDPSRNIGGIGFNPIVGATSWPL